MTHKTSRRGVSLIMVICCIALLTVMIGASARHGMDQKRYLDQRVRRTQAYWLAQAGIERAAAKLQTDGKNYAGEIIQPIAQSEVRIRVEPLKDRPDTYQISSEAIYPQGDAGRASVEAQRTIKILNEETK